MIALYSVHRRFGTLGEWSQIAICPTYESAMAFRHACSAKWQYKIEKTHLCAYGLSVEKYRELSAAMAAALAKE